jgi:hypothetical protein
LFYCKTNWKEGAGKQNKIRTEELIYDAVNNNLHIYYSY